MFYKLIFCFISTILSISDGEDFNCRKRRIAKKKKIAKALTSVQNAKHFGAV